MTHTLSDAIMSNMEIHMHKKSFISFGLYKYNLNIEKLNNNWIKIPKNSNIKNVLKKQKINKLYFDKIIRKNKIRSLAGMICILHLKGGFPRYALYCISI